MRSLYAVLGFVMFWGWILSIQLPEISTIIAKGATGQ